MQPFVENQYQQKSLPGKDKKLPHFGVGAHFELVGKHFVIRSLVKDGPAARSGKIAVGDLLVSIDNHGAGKIFFVPFKSWNVSLIRYTCICHPG